MIDKVSCLFYVAEHSFALQFKPQVIAGFSLLVKKQKCGVNHFCIASAYIVVLIGRIIIAIHKGIVPKGAIPIIGHARVVAGVGV